MLLTQSRRSPRLPYPAPSDRQIGTQSDAGFLSPRSGGGRCCHYLAAEHYRGIYPDAEIDRYDTERHLRRDLARISDPSYRVYLILDGDRPIGYLYFQHRDGVHIQSLYVLREYQRCGIGRMAFETVQAYCCAQGLPGFTCNCNAHNRNARAFYEHLGGTVVAEDVGHINLQEDQITYAFPVCTGSSAKNDGSDKSGWRDTIMNFEFRPLTKEDAAYIGEKINEIVPREVDAEEEEFVLKVENETGEIIGGCIAEVYEYHWSRLFLEDLWVDERYRHQGIGSMMIREVERIAREKGCRVVTLGTASYMARPFYEKHGYTVFTTVKTPNGFLSYSLVKYLDRDTPEYVPTNNSGARFKLSLGNSGDAESDRTRSFCLQRSLRS